MCLNIKKTRDYVEEIKNYISNGNMRNQANEKRRKRKKHFRENRVVYQSGNKRMHFFLAQL